MAEVVLWNHYPKTNALLFFCNLAAHRVYRKNCLSAEVHGTRKYNWLVTLVGSLIQEL